MKRYDRLLSLGLDSKDATLLTMPIRELNAEMFALAVRARDKCDNVVRELNKSYKSSYSGQHFIISDSLGDIVNPMNGKVYDSKSKYYADVRAQGGIIMGNDAPTQAAKKEVHIDDDKVKRDLYQAAEQIGYKL